MAGVSDGAPLAPTPEPAPKPEPSPDPDAGWPRADRSERLVNLGLAVCAALVLAVAWRLAPDTRGHGTHEALGLPPCNFLVITGLPCLSCGMTTAFAHCVRGDLWASLRAQPFGFLLAVGTVLALPALLASALTGRSLAIPLARVPWKWPGFALLGLLLGAWAYKIWAVRAGVG